MTAVVNPKTFSITDPTFTADAVTAMTISVGTAAGGPYSLVLPVPAADLSSQSGGVVTGAVTGLTHWPTTAGTYFAVATATNATGTSSPSPEASFQIQATANPPTALSFA